MTERVNVSQAIDAFVNTGNYDYLSIKALPNNQAIAKKYNHKGNKKKAQDSTQQKRQNRRAKIASQLIDIASIKEVIDLRGIYQEEVLSGIYQMENEPEWKYEIRKKAVYAQIEDSRHPFPFHGVMTDTARNTSKIARIRKAQLAQFFDDVGWLDTRSPRYKIDVTDHYKKDGLIYERILIKDVSGQHKAAKQELDTSVQNHLVKCDELDQEPPLTYPPNFKIYRSVPNEKLKNKKPLVIDNLPTTFGHSQRQFMSSAGHCIDVATGANEETPPNAMFVTLTLPGSTILAMRTLAQMSGWIGNKLMQVVRDFEIGYDVIENRDREFPYIPYKYGQRNSRNMIAIDAENKQVISLKDSDDKAGSDNVVGGSSDGRKDESDCKSDCKSDSKKSRSGSKSDCKEDSNSYRSPVKADNPGTIYYMRVWESQARGALHLHLVIASPDIPNRHLMSLADDVRMCWHKILHEFLTLEENDRLISYGGRVGMLPVVDMYALSPENVRKNNGIRTWRNCPDVWQDKIEPVKKSVGRYLAKYSSKMANTPKSKKDIETMKSVYYPSRWWGCCRKLKQLVDANTHEIKLSLLPSQSVKVRALLAEILISQCNPASVSWKQFNLLKTKAENQVVSSDENSEKVLNEISENPAIKSSEKVNNEFKIHGECLSMFFPGEVFEQVKMWLFSLFPGFLNDLRVTMDYKNLIDFGEHEKYWNHSDYVLTKVPKITNIKIPSNAGEQLAVR